MTSRILGLFIVILGLFFTAQIAENAVFFTDNLCGNVSTYNQATRACTGGSSTSRTTIASGLALLSPGDTLRVRGGTYTERITWSSNGGTVSLPVVVEEFPGETVTWNVPSGQDHALSIQVIQYVTVRGITFDGTNGTNALLAYSALPIAGSHILINIGCTDHSIPATCARNVTIENNEFRNSAYGFSQVSDLSSNVTYRGNWIHHIAKVRNANILYGSGPSIVFENNIVEDVAGSIGLWCENCGDPTDNGRIRNNIFRRTGVFWSTNNGTVQCCATGTCPGGAEGLTCSQRMPPGFSAIASAVFISSGSGSRVYNNIFLDGHSAAIYGDNNATSCLIANNTMFGNLSNPNDMGELGSGIYMGTGTSGCTVQNNIVYQPGVTFPPPIYFAGGGNTASTNMCSAGSAAGIGCTVPPGGIQFEGAAGGSAEGFKLAAGSPGVDAGANLSAFFTTDYGGNLRATGSNAWELGAWEQGVPPQPDPLTLLAHWTLDAGFGTTATDSAPSPGGGHTGTLDSAAWTSPGIIGASSFGPTGTQEITVSPTTGLLGANSFSVSMWIRMTAVDTQGCALLSALEGYSLYIGLNGLPQGWIYHGIGPNPYETPVIGSTSVLTGNTTMLTLTYDRFAADPGLRLYVGPNLVATQATTVAVSYAGGTTFRMGRPGSDGLLGYQCQGVIDQVRVYTGALTSDGVAALYNEFAPPPGVSLTHSRWTAAHTAEGTFTSTLDSDLPVTFGTTAPVGLRMSLKNASGGSLTEYFRTYCRVNTGTWGSWIEVANSFGSLGVRYLTDTTVNLGDTTTPLLPTDGFTGVTGKFIADVVDLTSPYDVGQKITFAHGAHAEQEVRLELGPPLVATNLVQCKLRRESGSDLDSYGGTGDPLVKTITLIGVAPPTNLWVGGQQGGIRQ